MPDLAQNDIDQMFGTVPGQPVVPDVLTGKPELGQDDVDRMFG